MNGDSQSEVRGTDKLSRKARLAVDQIIVFGRRHKLLFARGSLAAIAIVIVRLALPWPLRSIAEIVSSGSVEFVVSTDNPMIQMLLLFLVLIVGLGLFDFLARLFFSRFSIATTRDLRQAAFMATLGIGAESRKAATGDIVSRLIGDSGRVKAGLQGFLLHVATNGLVLVGVIIILFTIAPAMAVLFSLAVLAITMITVWGATRIFRSSLRHRRREGQLANEIHTSLHKPHSKSSLKRINKSSARYEASLTRLQGKVTWASHSIFGVTVVASLVVGIQAVSAGTIVAGDVVLLMFYILMIRGPVVRLARQGTRTGKILGPSYRLAQMLRPKRQAADSPPALRLRGFKKRLILKSVVVDVPSEDGEPKRQIGPVDLVLRRGERIAIVDYSGDALRPLMNVIGGRAVPESGSIRWDGVSLKGDNLRALKKQVRVILPGSTDAISTPPLAQRYKELGASNRKRASIRFYLEPQLGLQASDARSILSSFVEDRTDKSETTIVGTSQSIGLDRFDRIIQIEDGRVVFVGQYEDWRTKTIPKQFQKNLGRADVKSKIRILFTGYAPVHFRCFHPLYRRLRKVQNVDVVVSGGLRTGDKRNYVYDAAGLYDEFSLPLETVKTVEEIKEMDFDVQFSAHTKLISPRSVQRRIQIFHGVSFRNKAIRPENMACDDYFIIGPYMRSRFVDAGLMKLNDPRTVEVGFMKTDALIDGSLNKGEILNQYGFDGSRPVLLYAPTGAKRNSLETMGEDAMKELIAVDRYDLLVKPHDHPKNKDIDWATYLKKYETDHCRIVMPQEDVIPAMYVSNLLISDASSVVNEYTLLDRPILFLDTPELLSQARDAANSMLDLDTWGRAGGVIASTPQCVPALVEESLANPNELSMERRGIATNLFFNPGAATDSAMSWLETHVLSVEVSDHELRNAYLQA